MFFMQTKIYFRDVFLIKLRDSTYQVWHWSFTNVGLSLHFIRKIKKYLSLIVLIASLNVYLVIRYIILQMQWHKYVWAYNRNNMWKSSFTKFYGIRDILKYSASCYKQKTEMCQLPTCWKFGFCFWLL